MNCAQFSTVPDAFFGRTNVTVNVEVPPTGIGVAKGALGEDGGYLQSTWFGGAVVTGSVKLAPP